MTSYVVMAPPEFSDLAGDAQESDRLQFVPDRFSFLAFVFSIVWLLFHRMWLVLLGYLGVTLVFELVALASNSAVGGVVTFLVSLLFGFEAQALRRWSLEKKGWRVIGIANGSDLAEAEMRFLHKEAAALSGPVARETPPAPAEKPRFAPTPIIPRIGDEQVVGLTLGPETRQ
ncbi:DUF2628 domain-containing protein [Roseibium aggregatum]|uniref:DUF2628 domain-containing protein n=1 Tax=Roseibium aggregatum TaxID=187304 RepID=A0A939EH65_9HYPH|nr:DUF2628 domain-containing protein [Roseibium aggregatum]MBN9673127.1 DUF2628 domain-containing protein [Roseibium aggregatum]